MTLAIIVEVKLKQVQSTQLKWDPSGHPLWFNGIDQDVYLVIGEKEVRHFEVSFFENIVTGGASKALQYGKIDSSDGSSGLNLARVVHYQDNIPENILNEAKNIINSCEELEASIKEGLLKYMSSFSFGSNALRFAGPLKSYVPIEKRSYKTPKFKLRRFLRSLPFPRHFAVKIVSLLILLGIIAAYVSSEKTKAKEFLSMDDRMSVSFIKKYENAGGDLQVKDNYEKNILHRLASHMDDINDDQFLSFKYLVDNKKIDPNQFDKNGKTPLYYVVISYLNPPLELKKYPSDYELYLSNRLILIRELLKMGLRSELKPGPQDYSAWDLGKQNNDLRQIMEEYR